MAGSTASPDVTLDPAWRGRALYLDILSLISLVFSAVAMGLGFRAYLVSATAGADAGRTLLVVGLAAGIFVLSFAWISARLVMAGVRGAIHR